MASSLKVAACHVSPVFLSAAKTTDKAISLIKRASKNGAKLVVFPETYIPAFPLWSAVRPPTENHDLFRRMALESVYIDGDEVQAIQDAAKQTGTIVSLGLSEKVRHSSACLFNSNALIGADGTLMAHHRKLMPTFFEKLTWSPGDGHGLRVAETRSGKIGALICGENTNPLARYALMAQGEQVHISTWPAIWPTRPPTAKGASSRTGAGGNYDNVTANRTRAAAHCFEAKCFGVMCAGHLGPDAIEVITDGAGSPEMVSEALRTMPRAPTMFLDPTGTPLTGYTIDDAGDASGTTTPAEFLQNEEGVLYADLDLGDCIEGKQYHDVVGGYQRLDVFDLKVDRSRRGPATFVDS
ncbi:hypothetical protein Daus18300_000300 [Diaporthe australafricana]|uniref:CN hydrolase domain-containing protein n=1 Tax=Diaporthe australafricana TaxID=127596 RepID=A0ABR3Y616_9PEZI